MNFRLTNYFLSETVAASKTRHRQLSIIFRKNITILRHKRYLKPDKSALQLDTIFMNCHFITTESVSLSNPLLDRNRARAFALKI